MAASEQHKRTFCPSYTHTHTQGLFVLATHTHTHRDFLSLLHRHTHTKGLFFLATHTHTKGLFVLATHPHTLTSAMLPSFLVFAVVQTRMFGVAAS